MCKSRANLHKEIHTKILHTHQYGTLKNCLSSHREAGKQDTQMKKEQKEMESKMADLRWINSYINCKLAKCNH